MFFSIILLFFSAILGGLLQYIIPGEKKTGFRLSLTFAGAYLFSITVVHLIPEVYSQSSNGIRIGIFMLLGYFLQQVLEYFSSGIEHGHLHRESADHTHSNAGLISVLIALSIHAFLEGGLLAYPTSIGEGHDHGSLLAGIVMHKIPAAFALMSMILCVTKKKLSVFVILLLFASASPAGLLISHYSHTNQLLSDELTRILYAIVCGSFLQISTTIVFESSPQHRFDLKRFGVALAGAITAILSEVI